MDDSKMMRMVAAQLKNGRKEVIRREEVSRLRNQS